MTTGATTIETQLRAGRWSAVAAGRWRRLLESHRRQRRSELPGADVVRPLPELPGVRRGRAGFLRPSRPEGYLAEWTRWLADSDGLSPHGDKDSNGDLEDGGIIAQREGVSFLIFRLGEEGLAFRTRTVAEVTTPRPVHRVPHRSNRVFVGLVNLQGRAELCVSMHGLLGVDAGVAPAAEARRAPRPRPGRDLGLRGG